MSDMLSFVNPALTVGGIIAAAVASVVAVKSQVGYLEKRHGEQMTDVKNELSSIRSELSTAKAEMVSKREYDAQIKIFETQFAAMTASQGRIEALLFEVIKGRKL